MARAVKRKSKYLCVLGPRNGEWLEIDEGLKQDYKQFNRAFSWGEPRKLSAVLIHNPSLQVVSGVKW